jgi:ubiquinone/menaquinone biosynthesis C-methylase UbiE
VGYRTLGLENRIVMANNLKNHWEHIYTTKQPHEVSWTQETPTTSIELIKELNLSKDASIIDVGGGDSHLVDYLLKEGYMNLTVLDISAAAIERAKERLQFDANKVKWVVSDILDFSPDTTYTLWYDRASFHFQITEDAINQYLSILKKATERYAIIGGFSTEGPKKCSALDIKQYNEETLQQCMSIAELETLKALRVDHTTPMGGSQNFLFGVFQKHA